MKKSFLLFTFLLSLFIPNVHALVLEDLADANELQITFMGKKIGFYIGSFDPLHLGHVEVTQLALQKGLCDYILIYPAWGNDQYKKRAAVEDRLEMLFAAFKDSPQVIVTKLPPAKLQKLLTRPDPTRQLNNKPTVQPAFVNTQFIGLIGSDVALDLSKNEEALNPFMQGIAIPKKYSEHTIGGIISLPVATFIISQRIGDDLTPLNGMVGNRPILAVIEGKTTAQHSSTAVKKNLQQGLPLTQLVSPAVENIIREKGLYR